MVACDMAQGIGGEVLEYVILPLTMDSRQVFTLDMRIDGEPLQARVEVRYFPAPDRWMVSIWDHSSGELLVNMIPFICSYGLVNDLLKPFRYKRNGKGIGTMFVLRAVDEPETENPAKGTLNQFNVLWGDTYIPES